jgi:cytochrome c oxidase cbb3-type subunit 1
VSFRAVAVETQFTFISSSVEQLALYGGISLMFFGTIYYLGPRLTGRPWASSALLAGHRVTVIGGAILLVVTLFVAGWTQGSELINPKVAMGDILPRIRLPLLLSTGAQLLLLAANLMFLVNFCRSVCACRTTVATEPVFRQPAALEVHA